MENRTGVMQRPEFAVELAPDERFDFAVRLPKRGRLYMKTGRGKEAVQFWRSKAGIAWFVWNSAGKIINRPSHHWWENTDYVFNSEIRDSFGFTEELRAWNQYYQATEHRDLKTMPVPVAFENRNGQFLIYMDQILLAEIPLEEKTLRLKMTVFPGTGGEVTEGKVRRLPAFPEHYYPVVLDRRFNCTGQSIVQTQPEGSPFVFAKIPFELPRKTAAGQPCSDLSQSWFREGALYNTYEEPNNGTFGGRWRGAFSNSPTRMQFRIPYRPYTALYVLADCPERRNHIPEITAQFYQPCAGFPKNFTPDKAVRVGDDLQLIRIPVQPEALREFCIRDIIELELTGQVHIYKPAPDSHHYSMHGGGLPSGIRVYGVTLETDQVEVRLNPDKYANIWTEESPLYHVGLVNHSDVPQTRTLEIRTCSQDGGERLDFSRTLTVEPRSELRHELVLPLRKYGSHTLSLTVNGRVYSKMLSRVRAREIAQRPFDARGFMFGFWFANPTRHGSLPFDRLMQVYGGIGLESCMGNALKGLEIPGNRELAKKMGFKTFWAFRDGMMKNNPTDEDIRKCFSRLLPASEINDPLLVNFFAEPGGIEAGNAIADFFGEKEEPAYHRHMDKVARYKEQIIRMHKIVRETVPDAKILLPWGDPLFAVPFLEDPETRYLFDGIAYDSGVFERMPEQQLHQCSTHRTFQFREMWKRYRKDEPVMITIEGPCHSEAVPGALSALETASHKLRDALLLAAYGINRQFSICGSSAISYWGEQHYGQSCITAIGDPQPRLTYSALATLVRHLRHMEFVRWIPVGSLSVYCLQFRDARDGRLLHVLWTIRGTRKVRMKHGEIYDFMDNLMDEPVISPAPIFVYGSDGAVELEEADHSDSRLAPVHCRLGNLGQLELTQTQQADEEYVSQFPSFIRRFPAEMSLESTSEGLAVTLPATVKPRLTMPYYTALELKKPVVIPGRPSHLSMRITAHSDWGRVVYVLRDAKGERFISVGQKDGWNCDDMPNQSFFNFDGTRLVRFEMPGNLPWDRFITQGSCWWGRYGGDNEVDLPLTLEKIFVERRTHALYVNSPEPASQQPVILADLYAEYETAEDLKPQEDIRRPMPAMKLETVNPIAELAKTGILPATEILRVDDPPHYYDGTRGIFHFRTVPEAVSYDIYLSLSPSGERAILLGKNLKKSGVEVSGFRANTTFHAFVVYRDKTGRHSLPSRPFALRMQDKFGNK